MATIRVKPWCRTDIGKQRERERDEARKKERWMRSEKITIPKDIYSEEMDISRPLRCVHRRNFYWFSVRLDSTGVVSAPIPHPHPLTLPFHSPSSPSPYHPFRGFLKSFLLLFTDISAERFGFLHRYPYLAHIPVISSFFSLYFFLFLHRASFLSSDDARFNKRDNRKSLQNSCDEYQINESILLNFNFLYLPAEPHLCILITSRTRMRIYLLTWL